MNDEIILIDEVWKLMALGCGMRRGVLPCSPSALLLERNGPCEVSYECGKTFSC